jgi:hypothetical protein
MNKFKRLVKEGAIGRLCQRGAWVVAVLGTLQIAILLYTSWQVYKEGSQNPAGVPYGDMLNFFILPNIATALQGAATTLFFCLILYSAGAVINAFFAEANKDITYMSLDDEDAAPAEEEAVRTRNNATYPHSH